METDVDGALLRLLERHVPVAKEVTMRSFTFEARREDERNIRVTVKATLRVGDFDFLRSFSTRLRIHGGSCPTCGRRSGFYYESILQLRAEGRRLSEKEAEEISLMVQAEVDRMAAKGQAFISKIDPVRGGIDFYLSSHDLGRNIAKALRMKYGGSVSVSPRLFGIKDGKEVYRTTHLFRLPRHTEGDIVRLEGRLYEVMSLGTKSVLRDLKTGENLSAAEKKMDTARAMQSERFLAKVTKMTAKAVEYYDPIEARAVSVPRPPNLGELDTVEIVKTESGSFVSMLRKADSRRNR